jgi:hypothetical protein
MYTYLLPGQAILEQQRPLSALSGRLQPVVCIAFLNSEVASDAVRGRLLLDVMLEISELLIGGEGAGDGVAGSLPHAAQDGLHFEETE